MDEKIEAGQLARGSSAISNLIMPGQFEANPFGTKRRRRQIIDNCR
jgi:hypothetical protein